MKNKLLSTLNLVVILLLIYWNYLSNTGIIGGKTIGSLSSKYTSMFTPASYAFAIWGPIFIGLIIFGCYVVYLSFSKQEKTNLVNKAIPFLVCANLLNGAWVYLWLSEYILLSVVCMVLILLSLTFAVTRLQESNSGSSKKVKLLSTTPVAVYFGWIMVALVANASSYLNSIGFSLGLQERFWVIILIGVVTLINFLLVQKRNLLEAGLVAVWALIAIAVRHWEAEIAIAYPAVGAAAFLLITIQLHAIKNKATMPFAKKK